MNKKSCWSSLGVQPQLMPIITVIMTPGVVLPLSPLKNPRQQVLAFAGLRCRGCRSAWHPAAPAVDPRNVPTLSLDTCPPPKPANAHPVEACWLLSASKMHKLNQHFIQFDQPNLWRALTSFPKALHFGLYVTLRSSFLDHKQNSGALFANILSLQLKNK